MPKLISGSGQIEQSSSGVTYTGLSLTSTTGITVTSGGLVVPQLTTAQRNALSPSSQVLIFNTDVQKFQFFSNSSWTDLLSGLVLHDAVVGSASQVTRGQANYSSITAAIAGVSAGQRIIVLDGTYTENITVNKQVTIEGKGYSSYLNGTITFTSAGTSSGIRGLRIGNNITVPSGANNIYIRDCWLSSSATISDLGTYNSFLIIQE